MNVGFYLIESLSLYLFCLSYVVFQIRLLQIVKNSIVIQDLP